MLISMFFWGAEGEWLLESQTHLLLLTEERTGLEDYYAESCVLVFCRTFKFLTPFLGKLILAETEV